VSQLRVGEKTVQQIKESLITRTVSILASYRRHCAQPGSSLGQLILPEALKLLPMYVTGAMKCDAVDGGPELTIDAKAFAQIRTLGAGIGMTQVILYPRLLRLEVRIVLLTLIAKILSLKQYDKENTDVLNAVQIRCAAHRLDNESGVAYLLENGFHMFLYIPSNTSSSQQNFLRNVFGVESVQQINVEAELPDLYTAESRIVKELISKIYKERSRTAKVNVVRQGMDKMELIFKSLLYEDKKSAAVGSPDSAKYEAPTYVDLLCHLHKEIRAQLN
ncbi:transport Sec24C-like protein, partial [Leptotrombidium deliense]